MAGSGGVNTEQFKKFFRLADLDGDEKISQAEAVIFFRGSHLSREVVDEIWMHADHERSGYLSRPAFYDALKLVTLAQMKLPLTSNIVERALQSPNSAKIPPPWINLAALPTLIRKLGASSPTGTGDTNNVEQFEAFFQRADLNRDGLISWAEAVNFFRGIKLPPQVLAKILMHADPKHSGYLSLPAFCNALKLATVAQSKRELTPKVVSAALYGPASAKIPPPQINLAVVPGQQPNLAASPPTGTGNMAQFEPLFRMADLDRDGLISGPEAVNFFQGFNLPTCVLAEIWMYADQEGKGSLIRPAFYNALKLATVAQSKRELTPKVVSAALYGPASAKIPPPRISPASTKIPPPEINLAAMKEQTGTGKGKKRKLT